MLSFDYRQKDRTVDSGAGWVIRSPSGPATLALLAGALACSAAPALPPLSAYSGMCDASAAVALDNSKFVVANDEDNIVRVYSRTQPGPPLESFDLNGFLQADPKKPETDFEGACWLGDRIYWITSHGRNREAKYRESRHRFFAMQWETNGTTARLVPVGRPYRYLLQDLVREPRLFRYRLAAASYRAPKARAALNIEALCTTEQSHLLIGFRNPIPNGRALLVPLLNPADLVQGFSARFGEPILLDLDGNGIRDMVRYCNDYLIVAGSYKGGGQSSLYRWGGPGTTPTRLENIDLRGINPEAIVVYPDTPNRVQLLSDDGTCEINGVPCKTLSSPSLRQFRSLWVDL